MTGARPATLVTGVAGFIGYHAAAALLGRGDRVIGIDNLNSYYDPQLKRDRLAQLRALRSGEFDFIEADFSDHDALDRALDNIAIDRIVHLGAQAGVRHSISHPRDYLSANLAGHLNILELARARGCPLVYASSSSVYGGNTSCRSASRIASTIPSRSMPRRRRPTS